MKVLISGGSGFIGSQLVKTLLHRYHHEVVNVDCLTYAALGDSRLALQQNLAGYKHHKVDVADAATVFAIVDKENPDLIVHMAAETHVDRSIEDSATFMQTNFMGTHVMLEAALIHAKNRNSFKVRFCYVSTDEVYGPVPEKLGQICGDWERIRERGFAEIHRLNPRNPYAATKAAAEHLVMAYYHTHDLPTVITRGCNTFGSYQMPEKFLPMMIGKAIAGQPLPIYGDGKQTREWLHVNDHAEGIIAACLKGVAGGVYNLGTEHRERNIEVAREILLRLNKAGDQVEHVRDRPGHDRHYAIDSTLADTELRWHPTKKFIQWDDDIRETTSDGLGEVIDWYTGGVGSEWCQLAGKEHLERKG